MKIAFLKSQNIVTITPSNITKLGKCGFNVICEGGIGDTINFSNQDYEDVGCNIVDNLKNIPSSCIILVIEELSEKILIDISSLGSEKKIIICSKITKDEIKISIPENILIMNLANIPRITRAQSMDILSSQNSIAGYRAVIEAAKLSKKIIPMMTTAAINIKPAKFLIIGAGVAGLQAIATAKRLGGQVWACDVRKDSKEEVESLGGKFIQIPISNIKIDGGYVTEFEDEELKVQKEILVKNIIESDVIICTALIRNKKSPIIITKDMVSQMKYGSIIIDLAVDFGGNCEISKKGIIDVNGVKIYGNSNLNLECLDESSEMLSSNIREFIIYLYKKSLFSLIYDIDFEKVKSFIKTEIIDKSIDNDLVISLLKDEIFIKTLFFGNE